MYWLPEMHKTPIDAGFIVFTIFKMNINTVKIFIIKSSFVPVVKKSRLPKLFLQ